VCNLARAADYPVRPIRIFCPYAAGGSADYVTRLIAEQLGKRLGQRVVVENRTGAGEIISTQAVVTAEPDGYTLGMVSNVMTLNPFIRKDMPYKISDLAVVTQHITVASIIVVSPEAPAKSLSEFLEWAKTKRDKVTVGTVAPSSVIVWKRLEKAVGAEFVYVPYAGNAPALVGLLGGQIETMQVTYYESSSYLDAGSVRPIAVMNPERMLVLPNLPAVAEFVPGFSHVAWNGFVLPAKTPEAIVKLLSKAISEIVRTPEVSKILIERGYGVVGNSPEEFAAWVKSDLEANEIDVKAAGLTIQ
jgi:tripartite-type tricarboxylate transporter receptor subunit TctC